MTPTVTFVIDRDGVVGEGGFLTLRRLHMHGERGDGTRTDGFVCDFVRRPYGQDAVVVALWCRGADGAPRVLLRLGLRPAVRYGRSAALAPIADARQDGWLWELPAGIVEPGDVGEAGLRARAAAEAREEAGFVVAPSAFTLLGAGSYPSPGALAEKYYFLAAEVDPAAQGPLPGDGSPMEEGAITAWRGLDEIVAACVAGELEDGKTELALRRLRDRLG